MVSRELLPISIIILMFAIGFFAGPLVKTNYDGQVPAQWGENGMVSGWESKAVSLYLVPVLAAIFYAAFMSLPHLGIYKRDAEHFASQFQGFKVIFVFVMAVIYVATLIPALGIWGSFDPLYIMVPAIALIFFYVGYMLNFGHPAAQSSSDRSRLEASERTWENANRFGSMLFWLCAALILAALVAPADARLWLLLLPLILCALAVFSYSLHEYRKTCRMHGIFAQAKQAPSKGKKAGKKGRK